MATGRPGREAGETGDEGEADDSAILRSFRGQFLQSKAMQGWECSKMAVVRGPRLASLSS